jgi:hypothetical protein
VLKLALAIKYLIIRAITNIMGEAGRAAKIELCYQRIKSPP